MTNKNHYICIHGHFYQPPRENPWLGIIEKQEGAAPFHDWNERICAECYAACARARIHDRERTIDRLADNFLNISFNIGPTLFDWLEKYHPHTVNRIVSADRKSVDRFDSHGNALAQVYNHMIMPLCSERDRHTQIIWGLYDFKSRFARDAEGMWLAECAIDQQTVNALIDNGIKFTILAPTQAKKYRALHEDRWHKVKYDTFDTRFPYRVYAADEHGNKNHEKYLDIFFYDGNISNGIAFNHLLRSADKMLDHFEQDFDADAIHPQLVSAATDGESYGHHEPYGEMCLAYFFEELVKKDGQTVTNYAHFLSLVESGFEVELCTGDRGEGSSWSCSHGVGRWYYNCGCSDGGLEGWTQDWRTPLRDAFNDLKGELDNIYEEEGGKVLTDPWLARDNYISVIRDGSQESRKLFIEKHATDSGKNSVERIWTLLEMQKHSMLMFTSCAWFFSDVSGVEPVQNMRYALRAVQHAAGFTEEDLRSRLIQHLKKAVSNNPEMGTGADIFRKYAEGTSYTKEQIAACFAMFRMYGLETPPFAYKVRYEETDSESINDIRVLCGFMDLEDISLGSETKYAFFAAHISDREAACAVKECGSEDEAYQFIKIYDSLSGDALTDKLRSEGYLVRDMPAEQRSVLLDHILASRLEEVDQAYSEKYDELKPLLEILSENEIEAPEIMKVSAEFVLSRRFADICKGIAGKGTWDKEAAESARLTLKEAELYKLKIDHAPASPVMADFVLSYLDRLAEQIEAGLLSEATELVNFCKETGFFFENGGKIENRYWYILRRQVVPLINKLNSGEYEEGSAVSADGHDLVNRVYTLGRALNFSERHMDKLLEFMKHSEPDEGEL
ncbi:MAG: DUF3536 domain-containing protein [Planctomycetota bacterium]|jgi:alpha-amylase/alpha-mannosidase (GH57 family)